MRHDMDAALIEQLRNIFQIRVARFGVVGLASTAISIAVYDAVFLVTGRLLLAVVLCVAAGAINGAYWHRSWTYKDRRREQAWVQVSRFLLVNLVSCCISTTASAALMAWWPDGSPQTRQARTEMFWRLALGTVHHRYSPLLVNAGAVLGGLISFGWGYALNTLWAFRR